MISLPTESHRFDLNERLRALQACWPCGGRRTTDAGARCSTPREVRRIGGASPLAPRHAPYGSEELHLRAVPLLHTSDGARSSHHTLRLPMQVSCKSLGHHKPTPLRENCGVRAANSARDGARGHTPLTLALWPLPLCYHGASQVCTLECTTPTTS